MGESRESVVDHPPARFAGGDLWYRIGEAFANISGRALLWAARCWARSDDPRRLARLEEALRLVKFASIELGWDYQKSDAAFTSEQKP
jgi:hypothetical protein